MEHLYPLSGAENRLLEECQKPNRVAIGGGDKPVAASDDNTIRAEILRILLTAPNSILHDKGLRLRGAWITGPLDMQGVTCPYDVTLRSCHLSDPINLLNARVKGLHLSDTSLAGIAADSCRFDGSVYLRDGTRVDGEVSLAGAKIDGSLQICGAELMASGQDALFAPSLAVEGSVFLGNYPFSEGVTTLVCSGTVFLASAQIAHDCFVSNTAISLNPDLNGFGVFGALEEHGHDIALSLGRARIAGLLFFQDNQIGQGTVNLSGAFAGRFKDEPAGPGANYPIRLDGFRYTDFSRHTDTSLEARLGWLNRRPEGTPFTAQPYEQLASVLASLGHHEDARTILIQKERLLRAENRQVVAEREGQSLRWGLSLIMDWMLRVTVAYGFKPGRSVIIALALIVGLGAFYHKTWTKGDMTPNAAPILVSAPWVAATQSHPENPGAFWSQPGQAGQDWETFNGFAYAADLVVPIISLGQESAWAPSTSRSDWGRAGWWIRWFAKAIGWVIAALVAAAITGVIRRD